MNTFSFLLSLVFFTPKMDHATVLEMKLCVQQWKTKICGHLWFIPSSLSSANLLWHMRHCFPSSGACLLFWVLIKWRPSLVYLQNGGDFNKDNSTFPSVLSCVVEPTTRIRNRDHRRAQFKQGGSEMGHTWPAREHKTIVHQQRVSAIENRRLYLTLSRLYLTKSSIKPV